MQVTFSEGAKHGGVVALTCRETGGEFIIQPNPLGGYSILHNNRKVAERSTIAWALAFVEQQAKLEFRTAQSESAWA